MKSFTSILFLTMAWITSCAPLATVQPAVSPVVPSETPSIPTNTPISTPKIEIASTPSLPSTPTIAVEEKCMKIEEQVPEDLKLSGVWLVGKTNPYFEDIATGKKIGIPLHGSDVLSSDFEGYAVSPNREWLAYIDQYLDIDGASVTKRILRIINSSGESLPMDFWSENFQWIIGWVDNNNIALELNKTSVSQQKIVIFNPFTGDYKDITPTWIKGYHDLDPYWLPQIYYSPDASRAVVAANREFEVKDVQIGNALFQGEHIDILPDLAWSSDSSKLAIVDDGSRYLYIIDKNDNIVKLEALTFDNLFRFWGVWWSPNSQSLLFHVDKFHILNLKSHKIITLCFDDNILGNRGREPLWSPNNRFIILNVSQYSDLTGRMDFSVLIDIQEMRTYQLPRKSINYERLAWLATP